MLIDRQGRKRFTLNPIREVRCAYAASLVGINAMLVEEAALKQMNLTAVSNRHPKQARKIRAAVNIVKGAEQWQV